ncbi:hypothetical protein [Mangrovibacterium diazotrophicum]|uniref:Heavy-metal resistance protein n=1 Tax=Mangrovibacterium diazotrophicum TaxID=1261403 RepID=A0A419W995_9BACT|nr:hypothetical protein [Mangrovibacterium diazotrophicum]RKD92045.1 hypothetical protein BC643_2415 [Mangrovibacterium diazotrophicum]
MKTKHFFTGMLALLAIVVLSSFMAAKGLDPQRFFQRSPETRANVITTVMKNRLDLDDDQAEKAYAINLRYAQLNQKFIENNPDLEIQPEMVALNKQRKDELKALLTPEQEEKAEALRDKLINRLEFVLKQLKENN